MQVCTVQCFDAINQHLNRLGMINNAFWKVEVKA